MGGGAKSKDFKGSLKRLGGYLRPHSLKIALVIALTALAMTGDREKCLQSGMDAYVSKPINAGELFGTLNRLFPNRAGSAAPVGAVARPVAEPPAATRWAPPPSPSARALWPPLPAIGRRNRA